METDTPRIVVLGGGFGGLAFCQSFPTSRARITLVDRQNHHLFQPLLYQVATAGLSAADIAQPIRSILSDHPNVEVVLDKVVDIRLPEKTVVLAGGALPYDYLVIALGGATSYFGHPEWEQFAPGLKSLDDALRIRREILLAFEKAEASTTAEDRERFLTIVVVGGGPTGVELAGAFAELAQHVLTRDFRHIDPADAKVVLIEASPVVLSHLPFELASSAQQQLASLGVDVRTSTRVLSIQKGRVETSGGVINAENIVWAAGVSATPLSRKLGVELDRAGRVKVAPDLSVPGHPEAFVIGDMALAYQENGTPVPGVSPAAMQMARHVATLVNDEMDVGPTAPSGRPAFRYWDKGTMATIGRSKAVAKIGDLEFSGFMAWMAWLAIHLIFLVGFRNKASVLFSWAYSYFTYKRGARIVTGLSDPVRPPAPPPSA